jgi:hypothetical protein
LSFRSHWAWVCSGRALGSGHTRGRGSQTQYEGVSIAAVYCLGCVFVCLCDLVMLRTRIKRGRATLLTRCRSRGDKLGEEEEEEEEEEEGEEDEEQRRGDVMRSCACLDAHHIRQKYMHALPKRGRTQSCSFQAFKTHRFVMSVPPCTRILTVPRCFFFLLPSFYAATAANESKVSLPLSFFSTTSRRKQKHNTHQTRTCRGNCPRFIA